VSPRKNRRAPAEEGSERPISSKNEWTEEHPDGLYRVRALTGSSATKVYRCPGCDHEIRMATPHIVAWLDEEEGLHAGADYRRHWHKACWEKKNNRRPKR